MSILEPLERFYKHNPKLTIESFLIQNSTLFNNESQFNIEINRPAKITRKRNIMDVGTVTVNYIDAMKNNATDEYKILYYINEKTIYFMGHDKTGRSFACSRPCQLKPYKNQEPLRF